MLNKHLIKAVFVAFLPLIARYPLAGVKREVQVFIGTKAGQVPRLVATDISSINFVLAMCMVLAI
ncbi:hypothetical protein L1286_05895 [Pseudoalteromonas sp. SMS1]|uniref:hypothetical protein n=1 Tax=Pseudoalteromonas sp. SMS1 TaxID=2908894 RepID=UPI001F2BDFF4|nr:hypothetical protein [Pseudoalteromonas sp. SMS1]MCF2856991.1 hypothetical protein [Pseudoalteromonas sp. SMS1]